MNAAAMAMAAAPDASRSIVPTIRPISPDDFELERRFVEGLSVLTGYRRLFSARRLSLDEIRRFTCIDAQREAALIAVHGDGDDAAQVGVARWVLVEGQASDAEFALVIADAWQGHGLGTALLERLIDVARERGVRRLVGTTLSDNVPMVQLARRLGFKATRYARLATVTNLSLTLD